MSLSRTTFLSASNKMGTTNADLFPHSVSRLFVIGLIAACFVAVGQQASGVVIFANFEDIDPVGSSGYGVSRSFDGSLFHGQRWGVSFTTDSNTYSLDSATMNLWLAGNASDLIVGLYGESNGMPGTSLGRLSNPSSIGVQTNYTFSATGLTLAPNTKYWIVAEPSLSAEPYCGWARTQTTSEMVYATLRSASGDSWGAWRASTQPTASLIVNGTAIPEPSTCCLLALGVLTLFASRFHRRLL